MDIFGHGRAVKCFEDNNIPSKFFILLTGKVWVCYYPVCQHITLMTWTNQFYLLLRQCVMLMMMMTETSMTMSPGQNINIHIVFLVHKIKLYSIGNLFQFGWKIHLEATSPRTVECQIWWVLIFCIFDCLKFDLPRYLFVKLFQQLI